MTIATAITASTFAISVKRSENVVEPISIEAPNACPTSRSIKAPATSAPSVKRPRNDHTTFGGNDLR
jgi:hypothetical protein